MSNLKLEQQIQADINISRNEIQDFSIVESIPITLDGREAYKLVYNGSGLTSLRIFVRGEGKTYQIGFTVEPTKYDAYLPIVLKMIDSFEITTISK